MTELWPSKGRTEGAAAAMTPKVASSLDKTISVVRGLFVSF